MKKTYVISDVHLGAGLESDWFVPAEHQPPLERFFQRLFQEAARCGGQGVELVIAGDLFDTWVCPLETLPPTVEAIKTRHPAIMELFRRSASLLERVSYVPGNHDSHVTPGDIRSLSGVELIPLYAKEGLRIEHGNLYCIFNAPDLKNDPVHQLPLGYYISRLVAGHSDWDSSEKFDRLFKELVDEVARREGLVDDILDALKEYSGHREEDVFRMPEGWGDISIAQVRERYRELFRQWMDSYGLDNTIHGITGEMLGLEYFYKKNCKTYDLEIQVMGHTHKAEMEKTIRLTGEQTLYANTGSWISDKEAPACVVLSQEGGQCEAELLRVHADRIEREKVAHLPHRSFAPSDRGYGYHSSAP